jgi:hypothetical protein
MAHDPTRPAAGRQPRLRALLDDLAGAHATARPSGDEVVVDFGSSLAGVSLLGTPDVVRQLLTDALAQLDAIEAAGR